MLSGGSIAAFLFEEMQQGETWIDTRSGRRVTLEPRL